MVYRIESAAIQSLIQALRQLDYSVIGPVRRDGTIVYDSIGSASDLPKGWTDEQQPGSYRMRERLDDALFGFTLGPQSWKKFLFSPVLSLFAVRKDPKGFSVSKNGDVQQGSNPDRLALFGVRSCELRAIEVQDRVLMSGSYQDPHYRKIREQLFIVAVNCWTPAETCFCSSMGTGPRVTGKCDLTLTEVLENAEHYFIVEVGSPQGEKILEKILHRPVNAQESSKIESVAEKAGSQMKRTLDTHGIKELLYQNSEHPEWDKVGERCLSCANCTLVCPTCFCSTMEDSTDLIGSEAIRTRKWDSCFTMDFSYIHGGSIRTSTKARYRQWMTHKLASWIDQFGTTGCVGCGRCITWCPVGIDITDEARVVRENNHVSR